MDAHANLPHTPTSKVIDKMTNKSQSKQTKTTSKDKMKI
jgi:hypothetical protein